MDGRGVCRIQRWSWSLESKESVVVADSTSWGRLFHSAIVRWKNDIFLCCVLWKGRSYPKSRVFLVFVFRGPDGVGRYSELIEMFPVLYLYSILRRAFFLQVWRVCQFSLSSVEFLVVTDKREQKSFTSESRIVVIGNCQNTSTLPPV